MCVWKNAPLSDFQKLVLRPQGVCTPNHLQQKTQKHTQSAQILTARCHHLISAHKDVALLFFKI